MTVIKSCVLKYVFKALYSSSSEGLGFRLGPANGFTDVASENVDVGLGSMPRGPGAARWPLCEPAMLPGPPPNMFKFVITVFLGGAMFIPYIEGVAPGNPAPICIRASKSEPMTDPVPAPKGAKGRCPS